MIQDLASRKLKALDSWRDKSRAMNLNNSIESVLNHFNKISRVPRASGSERAISDYLVSFANENNLSVFQDEALNVLIRKQGTYGLEDTKTVILQGHMDMVCEKTKDR